MIGVSNSLGAPDGIAELILKVYLSTEGKISGFLNEQINVFGDEHAESEKGVSISLGDPSGIAELMLIVYFSLESNIGRSLRKNTVFGNEHAK